MLRITPVERNLEHEVFDVVLHDKAWLAKLIVIGHFVIAAIAVVAAPDSAANLAIGLAGSLVFFLLLFGLFERSTPKPRISVLTNRLLIDTRKPWFSGMGTNVSYVKDLELDPQDRFVVESKVRERIQGDGDTSWTTKTTEYHVRTTVSKRTVVRGVTREPYSQQLTETLDGALQRLRQAARPTDR